MTDDNDDKDKESPVEELKRGVGHLFRAAKNAANAAKDAVHKEKVEKAFKDGVDELHRAIDRLQEDKVDGAIKASLQELGRAFGNVATTLEREFTRPPAANKDEKKDGEKKPDDRT